MVILNFPFHIKDEVLPGKCYKFNLLFEVILLVVVGKYLLGKVLPLRFNLE